VLAGTSKTTAENLPAVLLPFFFFKKKKFTKKSFKKGKMTTPEEQAPKAVKRKLDLQEKEEDESSSPPKTMPRLDECPICMESSAAPLLAGACGCAGRACAQCARTLWLKAKRDGAVCPFCRGHCFDDKDTIEFEHKAFECSGCKASLRDPIGPCPTEDCEDNGYYPAFIQFVSGGPKNRTTELKHKRSLVTRTLQAVAKAFWDSANHGFVTGLDKPVFLSCGSGSTLPSSTFILGADGSVKAVSIDLANNKKVVEIPYGKHAPSWKPVAGA
jgi:hypothetical protein